MDSDRFIYQPNSNMEWMNDSEGRSEGLKIFTTCTGELNAGDWI